MENFHYPINAKICILSVIFSFVIPISPAETVFWFLSSTLDPCTHLSGCSFGNLSVLTHFLIHLICCHGFPVLSMKMSPNFTLTLDSYFQLAAWHLYWYPITSIPFPVFRCSLFCLLVLPSLYLDLLILLSKIYCFHYVSVSVLEDRREIGISSRRSQWSKKQTWE